jgi:putative membrane protein
MTAFMLIAYRRLPKKERYALPPRQITMNVAETVGVEEALPEPAEKTAVTLVSHFAYGAAAGAVYGAVAGDMDEPAVAKGVGFGLLVWAGSYLGWLPAVGLHRSAIKEPLRRNALMIGAHVIWGATTGILTERQLRKEPLTRRIVRKVARKAVALALRR